MKVRVKPASSLSQARNKVKVRVVICKKASLPRRTASGIDKVIQNKGYGKWFGQLFPLVKHRESAQPENAIESSVETTKAVIDKKACMCMKDIHKKVPYLLMQCQTSIHFLIMIPLTLLSCLQQCLK